MVFSRRMVALAAVVLIPLGIAATSFALTDSPESPKVPPKVELDSGSPSPALTPSSPSPTPSDEVVSRPPVTDSSSADDDDDDDGPGDDG
ncbi:small secreted hydrophilic protein [Streptomyces sp. NPDC046862]|uniref:small secreted hydrophilic protein n=1 Tax=Streptomyces sp. NPDC046862 TaxID=3154603 RepID=UPI003451CE6A